MTEFDEKTIARLIEAAAAVRESAHAPYSKFRVGAAVIDSDGGVHVGCNVENASYGLSVCAERHAVAAAVAAGADSLLGVAVVTDTDPPTTPCGACRQVLREFGDLVVISANTSGDRRVSRVSELLPEAFTPDVLTEG